MRQADSPIPLFMKEGLQGIEQLVKKQHPQKS